ncbi:MAG TPA: HlyD family efflux transporter periplasmic adaptor subunit [Gammaproteobacteria bacterium]|nr:HlyD family efflux transporter periplasmic adaptor subunit [Gammaproteobacteria bacterium]
MSTSRLPIALVFLSMLLTACGKDTPLPLVGTLERDRIELVAEAQEPVTAIAVHEGESVKAGALILQLDDRRYQTMLQQAGASRAQAEAHVQGAKATLVQTQQDFTRTRSLVQHGNRSPADLDAARAALDNAQANLLSAQAALSGAQAAIRNINITLQRLSVRAPRDAIVDALPYHLGERPPVHAVVAVLLDADSAYAQVYVPELLRNRIQPGMKASVHLDGIAHDYAASVRFISLDAAFTPYYALTERDRSRLAYLAKIYLDKTATGKLPVGAPVSVDFPSLHQ